MSFQNFILMETYKDAERKWTLSGEDRKKVTEIISKFKSLKDQKKLKEAPKNDIGYWMNKDISDLLNFLKQVEEKKSKTEVIKYGTQNTIKIFENDDVLITVPKNYEASCALAKGKTNWCIAATSGKKEIDKYIHKWGLTPYYIFFKDNTDNKYAVMVDDEGSIRSVWNRENRDLYTRMKNGIDELNNVYPIKRLKELGVNVKFKSLLKQEKRNPVTVSQEEIKNVINNTLEHKKLTTIKNKIDAKTLNMFVDFISNKLNTTELTDKFISNIRDSDGKSTVSKILHDMIVKYIRENDIKIKLTSESIYRFIHIFVNKFIHEVGTRTHYNF
jgi:hypothetical protein